MAANRQYLARAPGTHKNHDSGIGIFLAFCRRMSIDPYHARFQDICGYIEYLASHGDAPGTVVNKISHIRVHYQLTGCGNQVLDHPRVARAIDGIKRNKSHIPNVKVPIEPDNFISIISALPETTQGTVMKGILLVLYYGALRQSELVPRTVKAWNPRIQPTRGDCEISPQCFKLVIKTAKNMQLAGQSRTILMHKSHNHNICPVVTMSRIFSETPTHTLRDPLFMFPDTREPVPSSKVLSVLHQAMHELGLDHLIPTISLHSIRKSAATNAFAQGCPEMSIRNYGGWSSSAYQSYIRTSNSVVNASLIKSIDI